ncbi:rhomboid-like protein [Streptomyces sp. NPDC050564]|uniref:rhomboid-like protein n=1 Tax=Streptomyces sp. NPDC050564 TaxID=3365631 RepID=UPI0037ACC3C8
MDRSTTARADAVPTDPETGAPLLDDLLDGMPRQRGGPVTPPSRAAAQAPAPVATPGPVTGAAVPVATPGSGMAAAVPVATPALGPGAPIPVATAEPAAGRAAGRVSALGALAGRLRALRPWRLFPTPLGTPFTFGYAAVLAVTSVVTEHADPTLVHALHQASSTDVAHLVQHPVLVLVASALWIVGGMTSPYAVAFLVVLTALERRTGGTRAAAVFLLGHVVATLATEVPVGLAVLAGHLPDSSLHRLDYGISFGVAASVGALAGLLSPWLRWPVLIGFAAMLVGDLLAFTDPMTDWGHLMSLTIGISTWPLVRRRRTARMPSSVSPSGPPRGVVPAPGCRVGAPERRSPRGARS